jgi:hypothetical protein
MKKSGIHYDDINGANIKDMELEKVWDEWVTHDVHLFRVNTILFDTAANLFGG